MSPSTRVRIYLDFVSPYAWLALWRIDAFARCQGVTWEVHPVVYAALLDAQGLVGPVETDAKRSYTFHDVARTARRLGLRLVGPPEHPFRSIEALRVMCLFRDEPGASDLAVRIADAAWGEGRALTDVAVLEEVVTSAGLPAEGLAERIAAPEVKADLRTLTEEALSRGVFGVPTFEHQGALFWGHDRLDHLADHLEGRLGGAADVAERMLARPRGAARRR